jgi:hypothetical protein
MVKQPVNGGTRLKPSSISQRLYLNVVGSRRRNGQFCLECAWLDFIEIAQIIQKSHTTNKIVLSVYSTPGKVLISPWPREIVVLPLFYRQETA